MFNDIAEIRIMDLQEPLELTDEQYDALIPVMGSGIRQVVGILFFSALIVIAANLITDAVYRLVDPRIKTGAQA